MRRIEKLAVLEPRALATSTPSELAFILPQESKTYINPSPIIMDSPIFNHLPTYLEVTKDEEG